MIVTNGLPAYLARPLTSADRRRTRLVTAAVTGCGVLLMAVLALVAIPEPTVVVSDGMRGYRLAPQTQGLAVYVTETGLRRGMVFALLLFGVPFVLFGVQALRTGSAARERRLAALSLAGASRAQLRRLAFLEGTRAAVTGGLLAGPGYLLLWLVLGYLFPEGSRMLPRLSLPVVLGWPVLAVLLGLLGGWAAALVARPASVSPLGITRRRPRPLRPAWALLPALCLALILIAIPLLKRYDFGSFTAPAFYSLAAVLALSGGPWLILLVARSALERDLVSAMAARRLLADVRSPGRAAAVLFAVGLMLGGIAAAFGDLVPDSTSAFAWGVTATILAGLTAAAVACFSLLVGVTEQVLDGRRATAVLVALAASPDFVVRVVRRQLLLAAVPAAAIGALLGWCGSTALASGHWIFPQLDIFLLSLPISILIAGGTATLGALAAARSAGPLIRETSTPENLRVS